MTAERGGARATTVEEFDRLAGSMVSDEEVALGRAVHLRPTDVVISPYAKCGTTWLQQMVHALRTAGDMDFDDISRVVPWIEMSPALGLDLDAEQRAQPRAFKSHLPWQPMPRGGRYLISVREPAKALVSYHRFMVGWWIEPGTVTLEELADWYIDRPASRDYWSHFVSWWRRRNDPDVLIVAFEQMKQKPREHVERVARFAGIEADAERVDLALRCSSRQFMLEHSDRFDDKLMREMSERRCGLPKGSESAKVKTALRPGEYELSERIQRRLREKWCDTVTAECGLDSYDQVLAELRSSHR